LIILAALLLIGGGIYLFTQRSSHSTPPGVVSASVARMAGVPAPPVDGPGRIELSGLTKRYGTVTAVDGLTFTAEPGRVTGFLGPNGAGEDDRAADPGRPGLADGGNGDHRRAALPRLGEADPSRRRRS